MNKFKRIRNNLIISGMAVVLLCACSGGGGGASLYNSSDGLHNGGKSGWGSSSGNNGSTSGSGSLLSSAGVTPPSDIDWQQIDVTVSCTRNGVTTTTTITDSTNSSEIQEVLSSFQIGDVVSISADVIMQDGTHRQTSSGAVTIGPGDNHFSLPTPYVATYDVNAAAVPSQYTALGIPVPSGGSVSTGSDDYTSAGGLTEPAVTPPGGYRVDHWETDTGDVFNFGTAHGDVTVHPIYVLDYTCSYSDLTLSTLPIINQNDFDDLINTHGAQDFSGKTIKLYTDVSTSTSFSNISPGFAGTFDGQTHIVALNLSAFTDSSGNAYSGLFAMTSTNGTIKNVKVTGTVTTGGGGGSGSIVGRNEGTVKMCSSSAEVSGPGSRSGGICGVNYGTVDQCYCTGNVYSYASTGNQSMVGGITGWNHARISNCYFTGDHLLGPNDCDIGGITGRYWHSNDGAVPSDPPISNCYTTYTSTSPRRGALCGGAVVSGLTCSYFYYDVTSNLSGSGTVSGTSDPLTAAGNLVMNFPSIWKSSTPYPTLINAP